MRIIVRADSGQALGIGHVMRCLTLVNQLSGNIEFICRNHIKNIKKHIPYKVHLLPVKYNSTNDISTWLGVSKIQDANDVIKIINAGDEVDILIVDHYAIDVEWEHIVRPLVKKLVVIDDLFNRQHLCDILVDQNYHANDPYKNLVPNECQRLVGLSYVMLRSCFLTHTLKQHCGQIKRLHICFGGADAQNMTERILDIIELHPCVFENMEFDIVLGGSNGCVNKIRERCQDSRFNVYHSIPNIDEIMIKADLCIGAGGLSSYERMYLGIPSLVITLADNQINLANSLHTMKCIDYIGHFDAVDDQIIINKIVHLVNHPQELVFMSNHIKNMVDGCGTCRVVDAISN